jgi:uncharacterized protein (TIGR04255 family)
MSGHADHVIASFERPPLVEVVCGVQFNEIGLQTAHFGQFWQVVKGEYPTTQDTPPLPAIMEAAGGVLESLSWSNLPDLRRVCLVSGTQSHLLQIQANRFHRNWRKLANEAYPRFGAIRSAFLCDWRAFSRFVQDTKLIEPTVNQVELTYVNHVPLGPLWDADSLAKLLPWLTPPKIGELRPDPELVLHYDAKEIAGRLHVSFRSAQRQDGSKVIVIELTARGALAPSDDGSPEAWLARSHGLIVRSFAHVTGPEAQTFWGRS